MYTSKGGCLCGNIRFEAEGEPSSVSTCHCRTCQKAAGGDSVAWVEFPVGAVKWLGGTGAVYNSSTSVERTFCPDCGTSLTYQNGAHSIDLTLACFDNPESFTPTQEIWLDHRLCWNAPNPEITGYRQFPSDEHISD